MMKKRKEKVYHYEAIFDPNGTGYTVTVPDLPGLVTEGDTLKEAREMAKDAIRCYLGDFLNSKRFHSQKTRLSNRHTPVTVARV